MQGLYLEDFTEGQNYKTGSIHVGEAEIKEFAAKYDPQPFHLDDDAAKNTLFGGLAASGWHTASLTMRLLVDSSVKPVGGLIGAGFDELNWPRPVRPGDELHLSIEILAVRASQSRPDIGIVKTRVTTLNQKDEPVQISVSNMIVPRRPQ